ncbi:MAG: GNAT family N-acetyltransferase [Candidatus Latescibacteria bacterium]|nr:GNAT family N-acetyltransferase [Candidatus Latescibacterota bacterium]
MAAKKNEITAQASVTLRPVNADTVGAVCALSDTLSETKKKFVANNAFSIAQAHFEPKAWFRAVYADAEPVGFIMLFDDSEKPEYFLWRFMIAQPYHGWGFGRRAIELLVDYVKTRPGVRELLVSCVLGAGGPVEFYEKCGFVRNGETYGEEIGLAMVL